MSTLANKIKVNTFYREESRTPTPEEIYIGAPFEPKLYETKRQWYRQAKLECGKCRWEGWTKPWKISGPNAPVPLVKDFEIKQSCPKCGAPDQDA